MAYPDQIRPLLDDALAGSGLLLEDVSVTPAGRRQVVRVSIDRRLEAADEVRTATPPLSLDEVADASRLVGDALERSDVLGQQPYTLEVTSLGVGRPLTEPRHFQRNVGRLLTLNSSDGAPVTGRLVRAGATDLTVDLPPEGRSPATSRTVPYAAISRAVVEVEFSRATSPGDGDGPGEGPDDLDDIDKEG